MNRRPPTIDMSPDGSFTVPPQSGPASGPASGFGGFVPPRPGGSPLNVPLSVKVGLGAAVVAVLGLSLTVAALAVYVISLILPALVIAGAVAWGMFRYRRWQLRRARPAYPAARPFR